MGLRTWAGLLLGAAMVCGCGATTRDPNEGAGAGGTSANPGGHAGGPDQTPPMIDGVPIGDCRESTSESRAAAGCPEQLPVDGTACEAVGEVKKCPYSIDVAEGEAKQRVSICHHEQLIWGSYDVACGMVCPDLGPHVIKLPTALPCAERPVTTCRSSDVVFGFETDQQWLDLAFERALASCTKGAQYGTRYQLELQSGCPARLSSAVELPLDASACISNKLGSLRWDCAVDLACGRYLVPIPTTGR